MPSNPHFFTSPSAAVLRGTRVPGVEGELEIQGAGSPSSPAQPRQASQPVRMPPRTVSKMGTRARAKTTQAAVALLAAEQEARGVHVQAHRARVEDLLARELAAPQLTPLELSYANVEEQQDEVLPAVQPSQLGLLARRPRVPRPPQPRGLSPAARKDRAGPSTEQAAEESPGIHHTDEQLATQVGQGPWLPVPPLDTPGGQRDFAAPLSLPTQPQSIDRDRRRRLGKLPVVEEGAEPGPSSFLPSPPSPHPHLDLDHRPPPVEPLTEPPAPASAELDIPPQGSSTPWQARLEVRLDGMEGRLQELFDLVSQALTQGGPPGPGIGPSVLGRRTADSADLDSDQEASHPRRARRSPAILNSGSSLDQGGGGAVGPDLDPQPPSPPSLTGMAQQALGPDSSSSDEGSGLDVDTPQGSQSFEEWMGAGVGLGALFVRRCTGMLCDTCCTPAHLAATRHHPPRHRPLPPCLLQGWTAPDRPTCWISPCLRGAATRQPVHAHKTTRWLPSKD